MVEDGGVHTLPRDNHSQFYFLRPIWGGLVTQLVTPTTDKQFKVKSGPTSKLFPLATWPCPKPPFPVPKHRATNTSLSWEASENLFQIQRGTE